METLYMVVVVTLLVVAAFLFFLGRTGGKKHLRTSEVALVVAAALMGGFGSRALFSVSLGGAVAIELAIGLVWIGVRKGYLIKPSGTISSAAPLPRDSPSDTSAALPSASSTPRRSLLIFLCYRRGGSSDVAGRIYDRLVQHFGRETVFKDVDSIPLGVDFRKHLADSVAQCQLLLAVIGEDWVGEQHGEKSARLSDPRDFVRIEIESALHRGIPVIPILVQGTPLPQEGELPPSLQVLTYHNAISVRPDPDFHFDMERLIKGIEHHLSGGARQR